MASIKNLKKDINYILGDIISEALAKDDKKAADKIVDETIDTFDELISKINKKGIDNKKAHLKAVNAELEEKAGKLLKKINKLD